MNAVIKPRYKGNIQGSFDNLRADYEMSRESRFVRRRRGTAPQGGSADYHIRIESKYYDDMEQARDMCRNDAVVGQTIERAVVNEIQEGFRLDPNTGDIKANKAIIERWNDWANDPSQCDIAEEMTFHDYEMNAARSVKRDGDCVITGVEGGALAFYEGHNVGTNSRMEDVVLGVKMNAFRKRMAYYIARDLIDPNKTNPRGGFGSIDVEPLPVRDPETNLRQVFHVYNPKRTTLSRGVTALAPVFDISGMWEDVNFAKVVQQQIVSCFAIFRQRALGSTSTLPSNGYGQQTTESTEYGTRQLDGVAPGMQVWGTPGEELKGFSPDVPNSSYFEHTRQILQLIGVNLGLPLCLVLMDGSETNFTGWRGAVDEARKGFRAEQFALIKKLHSPVYLWKLQHFVAEDRALRKAMEKASPKKFRRHTWHPQAWPYIEPMKDAQADAFQQQHLLTSPRRIQSKNGRQWDEVIAETVEDCGGAIMLAKKMAQKINKKFNDDQPVHWRDCLSLIPVPGVTTSIDDDSKQALDAMQMGLARERAAKVGDTRLADKLGRNMEEMAGV